MRARLVAWAFFDWADAGYSTMIQTFVFAAYFTGRVAPSGTEGASLWGGAIAAAGLVVALGGPVAGAIADEGGRRKPWLLGFTALTVVATAGLWQVRPDPSHAGLALGLVGLASIGSALAGVFYNALLPVLAESDRVGRWSGIGWGLGYVGGVTCLVLAWAAFLGDEAWLELDPAQGLPVRATCLLAAGWVAVFAAPLLSLRIDTPETGMPMRQAVPSGLRRLGRTLRDVRRHAGIARFLLARLLYADGLATLFAFGGVYAAGTFGMSEAEVLRFGVALSLSAAAGAWIFSGIDDRLGGKRSAVLALTALLLGGIVTVLAGSRTVFWGAALFVGAFVGPVQSASRSYMARRAPEALRNEMFGLYALAGKVTSFLGPALVATVTAITQSQRVGMGVVLIFFALGLVLLLGVPSDAPGQPQNAAAGAPR